MKAIILFITVMITAPFAYADRPSIHGMFLFGENQTYISHLPMFHKPHDYQAIFQVDLGFEKVNTEITYGRIQAAGGSFTIVPERMDLTKLIDGSKTTFNAVLFSGHFERGGTQLGNIEVSILKKVHAEKLTQKHNPMRTEPFHFFGEKGEYYAVHLIKSKPSYDLILKISKPYTFSERTKVPEEKIFLTDSDLPVTTFSSIAFPKLFQEFGHGLRGTVQKELYKEINELQH